MSEIHINTERQNTSRPRTRLVLTLWYALRGETVGRPTENVGFRREASKSDNRDVVEIRYGGGVIASSEISALEGARKMITVDVDVAVLEDAFTLCRTASHPTAVKATVVVQTHEETSAERLAATLWPPSSVPPERYPSVSELRALRSAVIR